MGDDFYYVKWHGEVVEHLLNDTLEEFLTFLLYSNYKQLKDALASKQIAETRLKSARIKIKKKNKIIESLQMDLSVQKEINEEFQNRINEIQTSYSYRIGRVFTWLPRKIRRFSEK